MENIQQMFESLCEVFDYLEEHGNYGLSLEGGGRVTIIFMGTLPPNGREIIEKKAAGINIHFGDDPRGLLLTASKN